MLVPLIAAALAAQPSPYRPTPIELPPPPPPVFREETEQLNFSYGWDRDVEELAPLRAHLMAERERLLRAARQEAARRAGSSPHLG